jgi:proliferating cell nuclear antigen
MICCLLFRLIEGHILKKLIDSMKDLVTDANFDCNSEGISLQAMDTSHVSLVALQLRDSGFDHFRCDRNKSLGINTGQLTKILKCAGANDTITLKADDTGDSVACMFETKDKDRISDFELKLIDIDSEHLGIPDTEYTCTVRMPSAEFKRIVTEIAVMGDTVQIGVSKDAIKFSVTGDMGKGNITVRKSDKVDKKEEQVTIETEDDITLNFALRYLQMFAKATPLSSYVTLSMSPEVPLVVEYKIEKKGFIRYYLAPKIEDEEDEEEE